MGWTVRYNHLGAVARHLPKNIDDQVQKTGDDITNILKLTLWVDTRMIRRVTTKVSDRPMHAEVWIGYNRGHGFYSRFQEWGTHKQAARPIVGPTAHVFEPIYAEQMTSAVRKAAFAV
jgi:HK97 gp10 family phage protein